MEAAWTSEHYTGSQPREQRLEIISTTQNQRTHMHVVNSVYPLAVTTN